MGYNPVCKVSNRVNIFKRKHWAFKSGHTISSKCYHEELQHCAITHFVDRKSTRLNSSHVRISYAVFCLKKKIYYRFHRGVCSREHWLILDCAIFRYLCWSALCLVALSLQCSKDRRNPAYTLFPYTTLFRS